MAEKTTGIYRLVTIPRIYELIQDGLGGANARRAFKTEFFPDIAGKRVLEVGCGPGTWFSEITACAEYLGMDWNEEHINTANQRYGSDKVSFVCGDVSKDVDPQLSKFDYIFAFGILHHLNDHQAHDLLSVCASLLEMNGRFLSIDPVYHQSQNKFAKWMNDRDSGQDIRFADGYKDLADGFFDNVSTAICTDKLRIPYSHCVMIAEQA